MKRKNKKRFKIYMVMAVKWDFEFIEMSNKLTDDDLRKWMIEKKKDSKNYPQPTKRTRVWGFFRDLKVAKQSVIENWGFNFDEAGWYNGAIIEAISEGYFNYSKERYFFRHKKRPTKKILCEQFPEPRYYDSIVGLTIG